MPAGDLRRILASTTCPAFVTDGKGQVVGLNDPAETLLGYRNVSVRGRPCWEVFAGRDRSNNRSCLARCAVREMAARNEAVNPFEVRLKTASGAMLDVNMAVVAVRDTGRKPAAILHLLTPMEHDVDEEGERQDNRPIAHGREASAEEPLCAARNELKTLTPREREILTLLASGVNCHDMARETGISLTTVRNHLKRIFPKLKVHSQAEAVSLAFRNKMVGLVGLLLSNFSDEFLDQLDVACNSVGMLIM